MDQLPSVPSDADPSTAVEEATGLSKQIVSLAGSFDVGQLASAGLAMYNTQPFASTLSGLRYDAADAIEKAQRRVADLETALEDWETEQERLRKEKVQKERANTAAGQRAKRQERETSRQSQQEPEPISSQPVQSPRTTQNPATPTPAPPASTPRSPAQAPPPASNAEGETLSDASEQSSCGPEIS